jgi:hypothetical protein
MHELSSAQRSALYRRFFELLNKPPGLYHVILNLLSVSYRKICSIMHKLHNKKVSEKRILIMVNCFSLKIPFFNKRNNCMFDVIVLFYISLPSWFNIKLCTMVDRERFSVFRVDHWVQKSGHPCFRTSIEWYRTEGGQSCHGFKWSPLPISYSLRHSFKYYTSK